MFSNRTSFYSRPIKKNKKVSKFYSEFCFVFSYLSIKSQLEELRGHKDVPVVSDKCLVDSEI